MIKTEGGVFWDSALYFGITKKGLQSNPFMSYPNDFEPLFFARLVLHDKIKTRSEWMALMVSARHI